MTKRMTVDPELGEPKKKFSETFSAENVILETYFPEPTYEMAVAGARSIANTAHEENHMVRARACWKAMMDAKNGVVEPLPQGANPNNVPKGKQDFPKKISKSGN